MRSLQSALQVITLLLLVLPSPVSAHRSSQSYSYWNYHAGELTVIFSATAIDVMRFGEGSADGDPAEILMDAVTKHVKVYANEQECLPGGKPHALAAARGMVQIKRQYSCASVSALAMTIGFFFDQAPSHVHFSKIKADGKPAAELVFTAKNRTQQVDVDDAARVTFTGVLGRFINVGLEHILAGVDHLAFVLAVLLLCTRLRSVLTVVTGFTLGHSVTLALSATELVRVNVPAIESMVGFTIAVTAAEVVVRSDSKTLPVVLVSLAAVGGMGLLSLTGMLNMDPLVFFGLMISAAGYFALVVRGKRPEVLHGGVAVLFGFVHGFAFANALLELNVPKGSLVPSLLGFNLGVEIGQIAVIAVLLVCAGFCIRVFENLRAFPVRNLMATYLCGLGTYWFVARALSA